MIRTKKAVHVYIYIFFYKVTFSHNLPESPLSKVPSDNPLKPQSCYLSHQWPFVQRGRFLPNSNHRDLCRYQKAHQYKVSL